MSPSGKRTQRTQAWFDKLTMSGNRAHPLAWFDKLTMSEGLTMIRGRSARARSQRFSTRVRNETRRFGFSVFARSSASSASGLPSASPTRSKSAD